MNDFFNKYLNVTQIIKEKREYKQQIARIEALPEDYRYTFKKIQNYMWRFAAGDGYDMLKIQYRLLDLFEENATGGKGVLEVTGSDVAAFVDELLKNAAYTFNPRNKLNEDILKKVGK